MYLAEGASNHFARGRRLGHVKRRLIVAGVIIGISMASCSLFPEPPCPGSFDEARSGTSESIGDDTFIATGTVARFVDSPDIEFRGYEVAIARHDGPVFVEGVAFVRLPAPVPGIGQGQPVLVLGERTQRQNLILPGECPPLQPIEDAGQPGDG